MSPPRELTGWRDWALWVLAGTAGYAAGHALGHDVGRAMRLTPGEYRAPLYGAIGGVGVGVVAGLIQWLLLRERLPRVALSWIPATIVGIATIGAIGHTRGAIANQSYLLLLVLELAGGVVLGVAHWLVLKPYLNESARWIAASAVGSLVGLELASAVVTGMYRVGPHMTGMLYDGIFGGLLGLAISAATGIVLVQRVAARVAGEGKLAESA